MLINAAVCIPWHRTKDRRKITGIAPDQETEPVVIWLPVKIMDTKMRYLLPIVLVMTVCIITGV